MQGYILRRLIQIVPSLFLASILIFLIIYLSPGDPAVILLGPDATPGAVRAMQERLGLDRPLYEQYLLWLSRVFQLDLGKSFLNGAPVWNLILLKLPATVELAVAAMLLSMAVAFPLGLTAAVRRGSRLDYFVTGFNALSLAIPTFFLGMLLILAFTLQLGWLPPGGRGDLFGDPPRALRHLLLPAVCLAIPLGAVVSRYVRSATIDVLSQDYIRTARSKGLSERIVLSRHAVRNSLIPVVTILGVQFGHLLGGAVVVESVFDWPGLGKMVLYSVLSKDYTVVQGTLLFVVTVFLLMNLCIDLLYTVLDPRVRHGD